jgi:uncharacterized protein YhbP (UPF0306 family)
MGIEQSKRRLASARLEKTARALLHASPLCAIATVGPRGAAHVNTAYFAWDPGLELVWLSEPRARHSRNIAASESVAIAVFDSSQTWGKPDRGIQLFGAARTVDGAVAREAEALYAKRFRAYEPGELGSYRFYRFRPRTLKLFDERELGAGTFVTARRAADGRLTWERTEIYRSAA